MPQCAHERVVRIAGAMRCSACGVDVLSLPPAAPSAGSPDPVAPGGLPERIAWALGVPLGSLLSMAVGLAIAGVIAGWPTLATFILYSLGTLSHEMGHAAFGWLLGHPCLPKFDLQFGGGVTMIGERSVLLLAAYGALIAYYVWTTAPTASAARWSAAWRWRWRC